MHSTKVNSTPIRNKYPSNIHIPVLPILPVYNSHNPTAAKHRRAVSSPFPTTTTTPTLATQPPSRLTPNVNSPPQDLYQRALERSTALSHRHSFCPINTGAISSHAQAPSSYLDIQYPDHLYPYYYYNQPKMAAYPRDIPSWAGQATYYYTAAPASHIPPTSSPRALTAPRSSPPMYDQILPTILPHSAIPESYMHQTFRDFASHAYRCDVCYDPLRVHLEGRQLCSKGHKLARKVSKALYEEANEKYRRSNTSRRRDGWQSIEVDIPKGCEVVRALINAMERGLNISTRPDSASTPATPATPTTRTYFDDAMFAHYQRRGPSSDEELFSRSRSRHREEPESGRSRSSKRSSSVGNAGRKPVVIGIQERERRPYGNGAHSSNGSTDSGYDTAPGSPDNFRRGSQYAEDMKRRKERPKSILKKPVSFEEREHLLEKDPQTPRSPTKTANQEKYVVFNISGECLAPGFD
ncbi:hypothetical protein TWF718_004455 [Orbilia javanica]|uniref:Uncharacterized protein n=1 Tax=Orbilia javanica TaxID=47235 RepID=A0AAN8N7W0_9PEZI